MSTGLPLRAAAAGAVVGALLATGGCRPPGQARSPLQVEASARPSFLGYVVIPRGDDPDVPLGGLSSLHWDGESETLFALSDDKGQYGPPRIYRLRLELQPGPEPFRDVRVEGYLPLSGWERAARGIDPEALAPVPGEDGFFVGSEGWIERGVPPFIARFDGGGELVEALPLPEAFRMARDHGPRQNKVFESLTVSPSGRYLFAATESGLVQDAPDSRWRRGSVVRILRWDLSEGRWHDQAAYPTDPVHAPPMPAGSLQASGLTDLLAVDDDTLLALERSFSMGWGFSARLYRVDLAGARDVTDLPGGLDALDRDALATKRLLVDFGELGIPVDNLEGLTFGPRLPDGRRTLLVVSDDNFRPDLQSTQLLLFAWVD